MEQKIVVQLDAESYFVGFTEAEESPLEPGVFLMPAGTVDAPAPNISQDHRAKWDGDQWVYVFSPPPDPLPPIEPDNTELRKIAYQNEADPIFFKWQRGEATQQDWLAKIEEIKQRYPEIA